MQTKIDLKKLRLRPYKKSGAKTKLLSESGVLTGGRHIRLPPKI